MKKLPSIKRKMGFPLPFGNAVYIYQLIAPGTRLLPKSVGHFCFPHQPKGEKSLRLPFGQISFCCSSLKGSFFEVLVKAKAKLVMW